MRKEKFIIIFLLIFSNLIIADVPSVDDLLSSGDNLYKSKKYGKAIQMYKQAADNLKDKKSADIIYYKMARTYIVLKDIEQAKKLLKKIYAEYPESKWADNSLYFLAKIFYREKNNQIVSKIKSLLNKKYPDSDLNNAKYWTWFKPEPEKEKRVVKKEKVKVKSLTPVRYNEKTVKKRKPVKIKSRVDKIHIEFENALISKILKGISNFTTEKYYLKRGAPDGKISLKAGFEIPVKDIPLIINFVLKDNGYQLDRKGNEYVVSSSPQISPMSKEAESLVYQIIKTDKNYSQNLKNVLDYLLSPEGSYTFIKQANIGIIKEKKDNLPNILEKIKDPQFIKKEYIDKTYLLKYIDADLLKNKFNSIKQGEPLKIKHKTEETKNLDEILSNEIFQDIIKNIKSIKTNSESNSITLTLKGPEIKKMTSIIALVDVETYKTDMLIKTYYLKHAKANIIVNHIKKLITEKKDVKADNELKAIIADDRTNSLTVIGGYRIFNIVEDILSKLDIDIYDFSSETKIYFLKYADASTIKTKIEQLFLNAKFLGNHINQKKLYKIIDDPRTNSVIVVGTTGIFPVISNIIENIDIDIFKEEITKTKIKSYTLKYQSPKIVAEKLDQLVMKGIIKDNNTLKNIKVKFIPIDYINLLIVISNREDILSIIEDSIKKFDVKNEEKSLIIDDLNTYVYYLKNNDAVDLKDILNKLLGDVATKRLDFVKKYGNKNNINEYVLGSQLKIEADKLTNSLIIKANEKDYHKILKVIKDLDKVPLQVSIEVLIAEVNLSDKDMFGIEWDIGDANQSFGVNHNMRVMESEWSPHSQLRLQGLRYSVLNQSKFAMLLQYMKQNYNVNIVSRPKVTAAHNKTATIIIGKEVPVTRIERQIGGATQVNSDINDAVTEFTEFKDVGISLEVTPKINLNKMIAMDLHLIVSDIDPSSQSDSIKNPIIKKRETKTYRVVKDNNTIVIGGLIKQDETFVETKVPVLNKIPVVGKLLFTKQEKIKDRTELLIFITPRIARATAPDNKDMLNKYNEPNKIPPVITE